VTDDGKTAEAEMAPGMVTCVAGTTMVPQVETVTPDEYS
jgi:ABC-type branched-subunit amino acid transport system permease subunit